MSGLRLIEEIGFQKLQMETIASTLGISTRHLRRIFTKYLGSSPVEIMQSRRLHLAGQLLLETEEMISDIAFASGFNSVRRFNESFKRCYRSTPSAHRRKKKHTRGSTPTVTLSILIRKPYNFTSILAFLRRHCAKGIEKAGADYYERYVANEQSYSKLTVEMNKQQDCLLISLYGFKPAQFYPILLKIRRLFDADHNPSHLPLPVDDTQAGVRIPGAYDPYEVAVSVILGQLISIEQATAKMSALIKRYGLLLDAGLTIYRFPDPADMRNAAVEEIGITRTKASAIRTLSAMIDDKELLFSHSANLTKTREKLLSIKGIGPWTTEIIMMRCFGDADASPASDLIIKRALEQGIVDEKAWKTNRSYMTHYIWNKYAKKLSKR
jgi:AraC family transcriptional regulator of adaptative response / DNA-3-methyladenine glycosylase II